MVASYSQESSIEQAFADTFGGDRPCGLCKIITAVDTEQESTPTQRTSETKSLELMLGQTPRITFAPTHLIAAKRSYGRTGTTTAAPKRAHPTTATRLKSCFQK